MVIIFKYDQETWINILDRPVEHFEEFETELSLNIISPGDGIDLTIINDDGNNEAVSVTASFDIENISNNEDLSFLLRTEIGFKLISIYRKYFKR